MADTSYHGADLAERIGWMVRLRWIGAAGVIAAVAFASNVLQIGLPAPTLYLIAGIILLYNLIFFVSLRPERARRIFLRFPQATILVNLQITLDLLALTALIHFSGGIENPFFFYFIFHMIIASILLSVRASYLQATFAVALLGGLVALEYYGLIPHVHLTGFISQELYQDWRFILASLFVFTSTIYISVYMATSIVRQLRDKERQTVSLTKELRGKTEELQLAYDKLNEADRIKSQYLRKVSHELRAPLAAVQSILKVVLEGLTGEVSGKTREMVERAESRTWELLKLLNDLLILSRSREAKLEGGMERVYVSEAVKRVMGLLRARFENKNVVVEAKIPSTLPPVLGDRESIEQLFTNLIGNAVKYTPRGGRVTIRAVSENEYLRIQVSDTGIGIPPEEIPKIFNEFYRAPNAIQFARVGTGLGLSIVKSIIDVHKGDISVQSEVGKGTTFTVRLPLAAQDSEQLSSGGEETEVIGMKIEEPKVADMKRR